MNGKSKKNIATEKYVDLYKEKHGYPPTYEEIRKEFKLASTSVAYYRCKKFRDKMKRNDPEPGMVHVKMNFKIPVAKYMEFNALIEKINQLTPTP